MAEQYVVKSGDTLSAIAKAHGVTLGELLAANPKFCSDGRDPDLIYPGEIVSIPTKSKFDTEQDLKKGVHGCPECPTSVVFAHAPSNPDCAWKSPTAGSPAIIEVGRTESLRAIISPEERFRRVTFASTKPSLVAVKPEAADTAEQILELKASAPGDTEVRAGCEGKTLASYPLRSVQFQLPLLVARSDRRPGRNTDGTQAADMRFGDYTEAQIKAINWKFAAEDLYRDLGTTEAEVYFANLRRMATTLFSTGVLQKNIESMIDHFEASSGSDYSNADLTDAVRKHDSTKRFCGQIRDQLQRQLTSARGDLTVLATRRLVLAGRPVFNSANDIATGLTIAINDTWAYDVYVDEYSLRGGCWTGKFRLVLWDHFGLDEPDVDDSKSYNWLNGFRSWFILQHLQRLAYRPFRTKITLDGFDFKGSLR